MHCNSQKIAWDDALKRNQDDWLFIFPITFVPTGLGRDRFDDRHAQQFFRAGEINWAA